MAVDKHDHESTQRLSYSTKVPSDGIEGLLASLIARLLESVTLDIIHLPNGRRSRTSNRQSCF